MKAAYYNGNRTIRVAEGPPVEPGEGEVRIDVAYCGICGTDLHIFHGHMDNRVPIPQVIGHEAAGTVAAVGPGVADVSVGDRVAVRPIRFGPPAPSDKGLSHVGKNLKFIGVDLPGGMQGSWTVPAYAAHKLPDGMSLLHGAMVEPVAVACHDVHRGRVQAGERCVIIGGGPIGLLIALVAREKGAVAIISEPNAMRRKLATSLGFDVVDPLAEDIAAAVGRLTREAMADVVFEVSGTAAGVAAMTAVPNARGRIVMVAIHPEPKPVALFRFFWLEIEMIGARLYESEDFDEAIGLIASGRLPLDTLITGVSPIDEVQRVFNGVDANPEGIKCVIQCGS